MLRTNPSSGATNPQEPVLLQRWLIARRLIITLNSTLTVLRQQSNLYWTPLDRKRWVIKATQYELGRLEPVLENKLKLLESLLEDCGKTSASYLINRRISQIEITTTAALTSISHVRYTHTQFLEQLQPFENSLHTFLQDQLKGSATKISLNIVVKELVK